MRIGMMVDRYKPYISGITNYIALSKRHIENLGHQVFVFTFGDEDYPDDEPNVIRSPGFPLVDTGYYLNTRYNYQAQKLLRTMDIVHIHHPFLSGRLAIRYCRPRGIPIVFTNHTRYDLYSQAYLPILPEIISETFLRAYLSSFCTACDLVIAPSHGLQEVLKRFGVTVNVEVVPNGVDLSRLCTPVEPIERFELGFQPDDVVLIYVGRLGPEKNLNFLLRAFAGTAKTYPKVRLLLVGDGPERDDLEERARLMGIEEWISFAGTVPYEEVPRYLKSADAFATASVTEVHPLSVIEAMASGLPVLGIHSPGVSDTVEDDVTGFLAPEEDLAIFTAKMVRMVTEPEYRRVMGARARQAADQYDIDRTTPLLIDHYQRLVAASSDRKRSWRARFTRTVDRWL